MALIGPFPFKTTLFKNLIRDPPVSRVFRLRHSTAQAASGPLFLVVLNKCFVAVFCYIVPTTIDGFPTRQPSKRATVKPVYNDHPQKDPKLVFKAQYRLMQVKSIAECSKVSILQYFRPSLSYHLTLRSLFCLYLSGRFTQGLLYMHS